MANKDRHVILLVVDRWEFKDKESKQPTGKGFELRVVHVVSPDGKSRGAGVEKVYFYDEGRKSIPKVIQAKDLAKLAEKWGDVKPLLENPGPVPPLPEPELIAGGVIGGGSLGGGSIGGSQIEKTEF